MSTAIKKLKRSRSGRHRHVSQSAAAYQQRGTSTAISKAETYLTQLHINSNQKLKAMPFWTTQPCGPERYINRNSSKKHIWRRCMSPARYSCMSTAIKNLKRSCSGRHSRVDQSAAVYQQRGTSTAISKAEAYLAQLCIGSNRKLKAMPFWTTQPCGPERYINRDQQQETYLAQMYVTSAV